MRVVVSVGNEVIFISQVMILVVIVFFVNLDLIDNGKGSWQVYIEVVSMFMMLIQKQVVSGGVENRVIIDDSLMRLVDVIVVDCLIYWIFGMIISGVDIMWVDLMEYLDFFFVFSWVEVYSYYCCLLVMLEIILVISRLFYDYLSVLEEKVKWVLEFLGCVKKFDVVDWVYVIQGLLLE